jgi:hypothetical protein
MPEIVPLALLSFKSFGSVPLFFHLYGGVPAQPAKVVEYGTPWVAPGRVLGVRIENAHGW